MLPSHCFGEQCEGSMAYLGKGLDFRPRVFSYMVLMLPSKKLHRSPGISLLAGAGCKSARPTAQTTSVASRVFSVPFTVQSASTAAGPQDHAGARTWQDAGAGEQHRSAAFISRCVPQAAFNRRAHDFTQLITARVTGFLFPFLSTLSPPSVLRRL